jgi:hypothetical protein
MDAEVEVRVLHTQLLPAVRSTSAVLVAAAQALLSRTLVDFVNTWLRMAFGKVGVCVVLGDGVTGAGAWQHPAGDHSLGPQSRTLSSTWHDPFLRVAESQGQRFRLMQLKPVNVPRDLLI